MSRVTLQTSTRYCDTESCSDHLVLAKAVLLIMNKASLTTVTLIQHKSPSSQAQLQELPQYHLNQKIKTIAGIAQPTTVTKSSKQLLD